MMLHFAQMKAGDDAAEDLCIMRAREASRGMKGRWMGDLLISARETRTECAQHKPLINLAMWAHVCALSCSLALLFS